MPDPATIPNGDCEYYLGTWSSYHSIDAITEIAHNVLEKHTAEDGEVAALPRTNILIPSCKLGVAKMCYAVEVADNMHIESISRSSMNNKLREPTEPKEDEDVESKVEDTEAQEQVDEVSSPPTQDVGASKHACDVVVAGAVRIDGIITRIVVKPQLPDPPVVPKPKKKGSISSKKKKSEEEQKRLEEEAKIYEEKVNEAIAEAKREEEHRMQFAHPERWSKVVFSNMTFADQVIVSHAHVTFRNCRFLANSPDCAQLLVTQYCQVECVRCTFECPTKGAVYGLPMGRLTLRDCLFTGVSPFAPLEKFKEHAARELRSRAVGVHTDDCKVRVEGCHFTQLSTAILLRGSHPDATAEEPAMVVRRCKVENIFGTGVVLDKVRGVELKKNEFSDCDYYALDCVKGKDIRVFQNRFYSELRVQDGAHVKLLHNKNDLVPFVLKEVENPNWQPVY